MPIEELRTVGLSVTVQERILADFKAKSGVKAVSGKGAIFPDTQTELLSGSNAYDCWETIGERLPAVIATNKIESIPTSALKNWGNIRDTFTKPSPKWAKKAQIAGQIWKDDKQTELWMVPTVYNYDSIGYRPDLVSKEEASTWTAIFDDKFKGKTGLNVDPLIAFGQAVLAMNSLWPACTCPIPAIRTRRRSTRPPSSSSRRRRAVSSARSGAISANS